MIKKHFEINILKSQEKEYIYIPFEIPENILSIKMHYTYDGDKESSLPNKEKNVIDFAMQDIYGDDIGEPGSSYRDFELSGTYANHGFKPTPLVAGTYNIILGAYLIKQDGVKVTIDIEMEEKQFVWLTGDCHSHTNHSDGKLTYEQLAKKAQNKKLDFLFVTDHNYNTYRAPLLKPKGVLFIEGYELTHYDGHINFLGLEKPFNGSYAQKGEDNMLRLVEEGRKNGAIVCVNHPCCDYCDFKHNIERFDFKFIEVWNGPMRKANLRGVELWDSELKKGKKIVALGGSDYHKDYGPVCLLGSPATHVYAASCAPEDIMDGMRRGHVFVTETPKTSPIFLTSGSAMGGDTVKAKQNNQVEIYVPKLKRGQTVMLIGNNGVLFNYTAKRSGSFKQKIEVRGQKYVRAQVMYNMNIFRKIVQKVVLSFMVPPEAKQKIPPFIKSLTNPIYFE